MRRPRIVPLLPALALGLALVGAMACSQSPEARRKEAQANADKYIEFLKVGNPEGAYNNTFSEAYRRALPLETWLKMREGMSNLTGPIVSYQVVNYNADPQRPRVRLTYAISVANYEAPLDETVLLEREGSEWKIASVEPVMPQQPAGRSQAPAAPLPQPSAPGSPAPQLPR